NNIPADKAKTIFDQMEKFGGYGFNKSHSAAYALIAYQTAYLKAHYPIEFMAALLTSEMNSIDGIVKFIAECRSHSIEVLPPNINESKKEFTVNDTKIRFGLLAVKNVGEGAIDSILEIIKDGKFTSIYDFCERVNLRKVNKRVLESLIKCGAFDSLGHNRSEMMVVLEDALDFGQRIQKEKADPQMGLFDMNTDKDETLNYPPIPEIEEWDSNQLLTFEKESLGFYISGHPLDRYSEIIDKFTNVNTLSIADITKDSAVRIGGIIRGTKNHMTKKGDMMAFTTVEDMHGGIETVIFPSVYPEYSHLLIEDTPVLIQGKAQVEENSVKILADMIVPVEKAEEIWTADIHLHFDTTKIEKEILYKIKDIFKKHSGTASVYIHIMIPGKSEIVIQLPETMNLKAGSALTHEINQLAGYKIVETTCKTIVIAQQPRKFRGKNNHYESTFT
ncbi:MAG: DNA polymerase III subunit alpha, partial [Desulfobacteraceae bacterium]|nr:DNA polymerase III subunit alpha [Desulfobacteraceae bacterium]